jgi:site-specific recombinase XerD
MRPDLLPEFLAAQRLHAGPFGVHIEVFATLLVGRGYARSTTKEHVRLVADLGRWLGQKQLDASDLDERRVAQFLQHRQRRGRMPRSNGATLRVLLELLRGAGVLRPATPKAEGPIEQIEHVFAQYLAQERGLSAASEANYLPIVRRLLSWRFGTGRPLRLDQLCSEDIGRFVVREVRTVSPGRAKLIVTALRAFLRWLHLRGDTSTDLAGSVPRVADWRLTTLPKSITPEQVEHLLKQSNRRTVVGQRDYAILLLLARLGLRAGEVVAMELDDLDWETGELLVRGKGGRHARLPLPHDVGVAIATYLRYGRPNCSTRRVFVRARAPRLGFANSIAISTIVARALTRAGLDPLRKGAHLLRHTLACTMLRHGASLSEIGEILRHRSPDTTAIYAKVDLAALRALAPTWPQTAGDV